jgi:hypothetical protein
MRGRLIFHNLTVMVMMLLLDITALDPKGFCIFWPDPMHFLLHDQIVSRLNEAIQTLDILVQAPLTLWRVETRPRADEQGK